MTATAAEPTLRVVSGNLFDSSAQTWVNTVNTMGVMGKGVALESKHRFPEMYEDYVRRCERGEVRLGRPYLFRRPELPWVLNFPTKGHWRTVSRLDDIVEGLEYLRQHYREWGITSLAVPPLGCGNRGLEWRVVGPALYRLLRNFDIPVTLYALHGTPDEQLSSTFLGGAGDRTDASGPKIRASWVALVDVLHRVRSQPYHWPLGRIAFQKLAYFATEAGLPTGLTFEKGSYGPCSAELKSVQSRLVNNGLTREEPLGQMFAVRAGPTYEDARRSFAADIEAWEPILDRVTDLFVRMRTRDAEVAATAHFAANRLLADRYDVTEMDVLSTVQEWKQHRRPPLDDEAVAQAIRHLNLLGWIKVEPSRELPLPPGEADGF